MKTLTKSIITFVIAVMMLPLTCCNRNASGCGTWGLIQYNKNKFNPQSGKDAKQYASYRKYNS